MKKRLLIAAAFAIIICQFFYAPSGRLASSEAQTLDEQKSSSAIAGLANGTAAPACCLPPGAAGATVPDASAAEGTGSEQPLRLAQDPDPVFGLRAPQAFLRSSVSGDAEQILRQPVPESQIGAEGGVTSPQPKATFRLAPAAQNRRLKINHGGLAILQIGDSHTAADFFTGEVRRYVQARYGNGGPGYVEAGRPHPGSATGTGDRLAERPPPLRFRRDLQVGGRRHRQSVAKDRLGSTLSRGARHFHQTFAAAPLVTGLIEPV
jgi:hypothetical protein